MQARVALNPEQHEHFEMSTVCFLKGSAHKEISLFSYGFAANSIPVIKIYFDMSSMKIMFVILKGRYDPEVFGKEGLLHEITLEKRNVCKHLSDVRSSPCVICR